MGNVESFLPREDSPEEPKQQQPASLISVAVNIMGGHDFVKVRIQ
jgi:hypothetical protein